MAFDDNIELIVIIFSIVSALFSSAVVFTFIIFFKHMGRKLFLQMIFFVALTDMIAAIVSTFGFPLNDSLLCPIQSFFAAVCLKASWCWTTAMVYVIYSLIKHSEIGLTTFQMHAICWGIPLFTTLLPLSTANYGNNSETEGRSWCFLDAPPTEYILWGIFVYVLVVFMCCAFMVFWVWRIYQHLRDELPSTPRVLTAIDSLKYYPIILIVLWIPTFVVICLESLDNRHVSSISNYFIVLGTQNGTLVTIVFFWKSKEATNRWRSMFGCKPKQDTPDIEAMDKYVKFYDHSSDPPSHEMVHSTCQAMAKTLDSYLSECGIDDSFSFGAGRGTRVDSSFNALQSPSPGT